MYPRTPGFKENSTSREAAKKFTPQAVTIREKVAKLYACGYVGTPDRIAKALGLSILAVRPRVTELVKQQKLRDTGRREKNDSGMSAKVYEWADQRKEPTLF